MPPGPKMVVCIEPELGIFFRINSNEHWPKSIPIPLKGHEKFLDHDSFIECGSPLDLDEYVIDESLAEKGIIGKADPNLANLIYDMVKDEPLISPADKAKIRKALGC